MQLKRALLVLSLFMPALPAGADWFFRGTPNGWSSTAMAPVSGTNLFETCQVFSGVANPRFKIDRFGNWAESYPAQDYLVSNGTLKITFNSSTKAITTQAVASCSGGDSWFFRGTPNGWATTAMAPVSGTSSFETCQAFSGVTNPRFKIDHFGNWAESYPAQDYLVSNGTLKITFNSSTKAITTQAVASCSGGDSWFFRGTPNGFGTTAMAPLAGTSLFETCQTFSGVANPRFRIDHFGNWTEAYPAQDYLVSNGTLKITFDASSKGITTEAFTDTGCTSPVGPDFRSRTVYFLFLDRFRDGNSSNNNGLNAAATSTTTSAGNESEWKKYWGGDLRGLIDRLDYLKDLGVGAIWVTPMVNNADFTGSSGPYHGYAGKDFFEVDEHLGEWAEVDELDAAMEQRGMKLVLDFALNHSNENDKLEFGRLEREGVFVTDYLTDTSGTWYHRNGGIGGDEWDKFPQTQIKDLFALADFNHGSSSPDAYLIDAGKKWLDHGVDSFRIDAIKHCDFPYVKRFSDAINAHAHDVLQRPQGAYIFGEWYGAGAGNQASIDFANGNYGSALLDFNLRDALESAVAETSTMTNLNAAIEARITAFQGNDLWQTIFLDNHDARRTPVYLRTTQATKPNNSDYGRGFSQSKAERRVDMALAILMTLRGIPVIYYGTEHYATWFTANHEGAMGHDPYNRQWQPSFAQDTPAFGVIKTLGNLRRTSPAIQQGTYAQKWVNNDVLVYERKSGSDVVVVAVNRGNAVTINVTNLGLANGSYTNLLGGDVVQVNAGGATFNLSTNEVVVLH